MKRQHEAIFIPSASSDHVDISCAKIGRKRRPTENEGFINFAYLGFLNWAKMMSAASLKD